MKETIKAVIERYQRFMIISHVRPDGDAVGSSLAMARILAALGKESRVVLRDPVPAKLRFLPGADALAPVTRLEPGAEVAILLDTPTPERSGFPILEERPAPVLLNIDHHVSNLYFGDVDWVQPEGPATCYLLYELARDFGVPIDRELAELLFTGIMTDTGYFRFDCVTHEVFQVAAELARCGADPAGLHRRVYEDRPLGEIRHLGHLLSEIRTTDDGRIGWIELPPEGSREADNRPDLSSLFANLCSARELDVGFCLDQKRPDMTVVELRSKGEINVSDVAAHFGGGGHRNAAGCIYKGPAADARSHLIPLLQRIIA